MAVAVAAKHALHAHPLGRDDFCRVNPLVVGVALFPDDIIQGGFGFIFKAHGLLLYQAGSIGGVPYFQVVKKVKTLKPDLSQDTEKVKSRKSILAPRRKGAKRIKTNS